MLMAKDLSCQVPSVLYVDSQNPNLYSSTDKNPMSGDRFLLNVIPDCIRHSKCLKSYTDKEAKCAVQQDIDM